MQRLIVTMFIDTEIGSWWFIREKTSRFGRSWPIEV